MRGALPSDGALSTDKVVDPKPGSAVVQVLERFFACGLPYDTTDVFSYTNQITLGRHLRARGIYNSQRGG